MFGLGSVGRSALAFWPWGCKKLRPESFGPLDVLFSSGSKMVTPSCHRKPGGRIGIHVIVFSSGKETQKVEPKPNPKAISKLRQRAHTSLASLVRSDIHVMRHLSGLNLNCWVLKRNDKNYSDVVTFFRKSMKSTYLSMESMVNSFRARNGRPKKTGLSRRSARSDRPMRCQKASLFSSYLGLCREVKKWLGESWRNFEKKHVLVEFNCCYFMLPNVFVFFFQKCGKMDIRGNHEVEGHQSKNCTLKQRSQEKCHQEQPFFDENDGSSSRMQKKKRRIGKVGRAALHCTGSKCRGFAYTPGNNRRCSAGNLTEQLGLAIGRGVLRQGSQTPPWSEQGKHHGTIGHAVDNCLKTQKNVKMYENVSYNIIQNNLSSVQGKGTNNDNTVFFRLDTYSGGTIIHSPKSPRALKRRVTAEVDQKGTYPSTICNCRISYGRGISCTPKTLRPRDAEGSKASLIPCSFFSLPSTVGLVIQPLDSVPKC